MGNAYTTMLTLNGAWPRAKSFVAWFPYVKSEWEDVKVKGHYLSFDWNNRTLIANKGICCLGIQIVLKPQNFSARLYWQQVSLLNSKINLEPNIVPLAINITRFFCLFVVLVPILKRGSDWNAVRTHGLYDTKQQQSCLYPGTLRPQAQSPTTSVWIK